MATALSEDFGARAMASVQAELIARIDQIERDFRLLSLAELGRRVDAIRGQARLNGMVPVARLAGALGDRLAADGRGAVIRPYLDAVRELVGSDPFDARAGDTLLASAVVRLG